MAKHLRVPYLDEGPVAASELEDSEQHEEGTCARCDNARSKNTLTEEQSREVEDFLRPHMGKTVWAYSEPGKHIGMPDTILIMVASDTPLPAFPHELAGHPIELFPIPPAEDQQSA